MRLGLRAGIFFAWSMMLGASGPESPSAGFTRLPDGRLGRVNGFPGAWVVEPEGEGGIDAVAYSGRLRVIKLPDSVRVTGSDGSPLSDVEAPAGGALFGFSPDGGSAVAAFSDAGSVMLFSGGEWSAVPIPASGLRALALTGNGSAWLMLDGEGMTLERRRLSDGALENRVELDVAGGPGLVLPSGAAVFVRGSDVVVRDASGNESTLGVRGEVAGFANMGAGWVEATSVSGRRYAVRLGTSIQVSELPGVAQ